MSRYLNLDNRINSLIKNSKTSYTQSKDENSIV
jgi:hypothetical protein